MRVFQATGRFVGASGIVFSAAVEASLRILGALERVGAAHSACLTSDCLGHRPATKI